MTLHLVKFTFNYADEFDVYGFRLMDQEDLKLFLETVTYRFNESRVINKYFGTNESIEFESEDEYLAGVTSSIISGKEWDFLEQEFGSDYGNVIDITE